MAWIWHGCGIGPEAPICPLALELPNAEGAALKKAKRKEKKRNVCELWGNWNPYTLLVERKNSEIVKIVKTVCKTV